MLPSWRLIGGRGAAELVALALAAISLIVVARSVGPAAIGEYALATSISQAGFILIGLGTAATGARAVAAGQCRASETWWTVFSIRAVLAFGLAVVTLVVVAWFGHDRAIAYGLAVVGAWLAYALRSEWLLVGSGEVMRAAWSRVVSTIAMAGAAVLIATAADPASSLPWLVLIPNAVYAGAGVVLAVHARLIGRPTSDGRLAAARTMANDSLGFVAGDLSTYIYSGLDRAILFVLASPAAAGLYDAAYKIIQPFYVVGTVATDAMYRPLAAMTERPSRPTIRRYVDLMLVATVPLGPFLTLFAGPIIALTYGPAFADAAPILAILGWVITAGYLSGILVMPTMAWGEARTYARSTGAGAITSLIGNLLLVPFLAGVGTALAAVGAKLATGVVAYRTFHRVGGTSMLTLSAPFVAASLMATLVGIGVGLAVSPWIAMTAFGIAYLAVLMLARDVSGGILARTDQTAVDSKTRVTG